MRFEKILFKANEEEKSRKPHVETEIRSSNRKKPPAAECGYGGLASFEGLRLKLIPTLERSEHKCGLCSILAQLFTAHRYCISLGRR